MTDNSKNAFPTQAELNRVDTVWYRGPDTPGMSLREYAAIKIMAGLMADGDYTSRADTKGISRFAVQCADALLEELAK